MTQLIWPDKLVEEIAYRRCILFLGSGISATAKDEEGNSPQTWAQILASIQKKASAKLKEEDASFISKMLSSKNYLMAVQAIQDSWGKSNLIHYLKSELIRKKFKASNVHRLIKELDSKIVISTNFDKLYESLCSDDSYYSILDYTNAKEIIEDIKSPEYLIIKAHGTLTQSEDIIFTAEQYHKAQCDYPGFYQILRALFLTHTVVFLGYSLQDPDIILVLQYINSYLNHASPHYLVCRTGTPEPLKRHWYNSFNVSLIEYGASHEELEKSLEKLKSLVEKLRESRGIS